MCGSSFGLSLLFTARTVLLRDIGGVHVAHHQSLNVSRYPLRFYLSDNHDEMSWGKSSCDKLATVLAPLLPQPCSLSTNSLPKNVHGSCDDPKYVPKVLREDQDPKGYPVRRQNLWAQPAYVQADRSPALQTKKAGRAVLWKTERLDGCGTDITHQLFAWALAEQRGWAFGGQIPNRIRTDKNDKDFTFFGSDCQCLAKLIGMPKPLPNTFNSPHYEFLLEAAGCGQHDLSITKKDIEQYAQRHPTEQINIGLCKAVCHGESPNPTSVMARVCLYYLGHKYPCIDRDPGDVDEVENGYVYDKQKCGNAAKLSFDEFFTPVLLRKFRSHALTQNMKLVEKKLRFDRKRFNVAMHIRRGDILRGDSRYESCSYYTNIVKTIQKFIPDADIHVFSQGHVKQFVALSKLGCIVHLDTATDMVWAHAIQAQLFVTSPSSFSYVPALMARGELTHL
jgi:hypothetical protein